VSPHEITTLREQLELSQTQFGQLFGIHPMTVSKWERGSLQPSLFQQALMREYSEAVSKDQSATKAVGAILVQQGTTAAIFHLLQAARTPIGKTSVRRAT